MLLSLYIKIYIKSIVILTKSEEIKMDRTEKARELFHNGYNCAQAVVGAYSDLFDVEPELAMRMIEGFGGGMGRMRLTCGAVSAMVALVGMKYSKGVADDTETRTLIYGKVRELAGAFREQNGTIVCGELLGLVGNENESAKPDERTKQYYEKRPCAECVTDCAKIVERLLLDCE